MTDTTKREVRIGRELALVAPAYALLTVVVTWPVSIHLSDSVAGFEGRDSFQHVWLFWWFWEALLNKHQPASQVSMLYFPTGASHPVLWLHPLVPLLGLPLTGSFGPALTYNLVLLISFVVAGILGYLLTRLLVGQAQAAFIGGLILAFAPYRMGHALAGHLLLIFDVALPLYVLALWLWLKRPSPQLSALYTVSLILVLLSHPNFVGYFLLLITPILLMTYWLKRGESAWWQGKRLFLFWLISGLAFLFFALPTLLELGGGRLAYLQPGDVGEHSADLVSFFTPSPFHPFWKKNPPTFTMQQFDRPSAMEEGFNYVGLAALILIGVSVWRRRSEARLWLVVGLLAMLFSLGPTLKVGGRATQFVMPYTLISNLPFFSWSRTPGRLTMTTMLAVSILGALGLACIMRWCRQGQCRWGLLVVLTGLIIFEYLPVWPFPVDFRPVSPYYHRLGQVQVQGGLLDMPVSGSRRASNYAMYYQTVHHKPLVGGYIERDPPGTEELRLFADRLLSPSGFSDNALLELTPLQRVTILRDLGVTEVVAHPALMTDRAARATLSFILDLLEEPYYVDDDLMAWHVPPTEVALPTYALFLAEKGWEVAREGSQVRLKQQGLLFIYAATAGPATLTIESEGGSSSGQQLWVGDFGPLVVNGEDMRHYVPLDLEAGLNWFVFDLEDCGECWADFSRISIGQGY